MAFNFGQARYSAMSQFLLGFLCIVFGIADRVKIYERNYYIAFQTKGVIAIWMGAWFFISGILGAFASKCSRERRRTNMTLVNTYLSFSIVAAVFALALIICYGVGLSFITRGKPCSKNTYKTHIYDSKLNRHDYTKVSLAKECTISVGLGAMILIFAVAEFGVSIWSAVSCCMVSDGGCCGDTTQQTVGQVIYLQTQGGPVSAYAVTKGPNGIPVAVPIMTGGPANAVASQPGGQVYLQNPQSATAASRQQGFSSSVTQQSRRTPQASHEPPPSYNQVWS